MNSSKIFRHVKIEDPNIKQLEQEILTKDPNFYTLEFKHAINKKEDLKPITISDFWKLAKIKAKKVSMFVDEILSCNVIAPASQGFIREITMAGSDVTQANKVDVVRIKEQVIIDEKTKTILFFQLESTGQIL